MIKAIFFDIDGTLVPFKQPIPRSTHYALEQLQKQGVKLFIATGRPPGHLDFLDELSITFDGFIMLNGQYCIVGEEVLRDIKFEKEHVLNVLDYVNKAHYGTFIVNERSTYANIIDDPDMQEDYLMAVDDFQPEVYDPATIDEYPIWQLMVHIEEDDTEAIDQFFKLLPHTKGLRWNRYSMDIVSEDSGKDKGIDVILDYFNFSPDESMAFGDGDNDIDMIRHAGIGVAMGNSIDALKEAADYVTDDITDDGLLHALQHFRILDK